MPRIPFREAELLPESKRIPVTGLQPAPIGLLTPAPRALGEVGKAVAGLGELVFLHAQRRNERIKKTAIDKLELEYEAEGLRLYTDITTKEGSEAIDTWDAYNQWKNEFLKKDIDINQLSDDEPLYRQLKKIGLNDEDKADIKIRQQKYFNSLDARLAHHIKKAEDTVFFYEGNQNTTLQIQHAIRGAKTLEEAKQKIYDYYSTKGKSPEEWMPQYLKEVQILTTSWLDKQFDEDNITVINDFLAKKYNDYFKFNPNQIDEFRDKATAALKTININITTEKYLTEIKDPFDIEQKEKIERKIKEEKLTPEEKQAVLGKFRYEINVKQQDIREAERNAEDKIFSMIATNESPDKILKAIKKESAIRPQRRLEIEQQILRGDYSVFKRTDPYYEMRLYNKILANPADVTDDDLKAIPGKLSVDDSRQLVPFRNSMLRDPAPIKDSYKEMDKYMRQTILQSYGADLIMMIDERGFAVEQILNAKPDAIRRSYYATVELRRRIAEAEKKGINKSLLMNPNSEEHKKHIDIEGIIQQYRKPFGGATIETSPIALPPNIKKTSEAIEWLKKERGMTDSEARNWLRKQK